MRPRRVRGDGGAAVVDFVLVSILLVVLLFGVLQVAVYFYVRNTVTASAAEGARFGANADVDPAVAGPHADDLIGRSLGAGTQKSVTCTSGVQPGADGTQLVVVRCTGELRPIFTPVQRVLPLDVTAHALREGN